ncbi:MAG: undecaprenyl/decaprenyl-phosphate alpha-N-acetylglucosaminyl 1-phosphate transferase [Clostridiales bacterium]|jgi:UDP-N-acetylmuramyl pentapeptide phosphotransferase/UDP-N-acetylglucosamine-1-phosphate transferase|nr:undecaprenyl/decaprenyl-phosphate alpha-N-acetylglucosaminyl 1-phosphate transferase [Clostridiales bacterium]
MMYGIAFAIVFALAMILMPLLSKFAAKIDFTDKPTERKKHEFPVPLTGGIVMFISMTVGILFFVLIPERTNHESTNIALWAVLGGAVMIVAVGLVDDFSKARFKEFPVLPRLLVQIGAASLAFAAGIRFTGFTNPFNDMYVQLPLSLQFVLTVLWFVGLITAFNFMDGLDGLSGLLALGSGITFFVVALAMNQPESALIAAVFVAAVMGFLRFNLPPARVYMGDSGAYLLGYMLAAISLHGVFKQATVISLTIPMLAMGVPIFDSILVVVRRIMAKKPAHIADSSDVTHIHFRLLKNGVKPAHAVLIIFLFSACLNLTSIILLLAF